MRDIILHYNEGAMLKFPVMYIGLVLVFVLCKHFDVTSQYLPLYSTHHYKAGSNNLRDNDILGCNDWKRDDLVCFARLQIIKHKEEISLGEKYIKSWLAL